MNNLRFLPPGGPRDHLGISHAAKHYLNVAELWEDVAHMVEAPHRPAVVLRTYFGDSHPWNHKDDCASSAAHAHWPVLAETYDHGYCTVLNAYHSRGVDDEVRTSRNGRPVRVMHLGDGIIFEVWMKTGEMRTALRKTGATLRSTKAYELLDYGTDALARRLKQARHRAQRCLVAIRDNQDMGDEA